MPEQEIRRVPITTRRTGMHQPVWPRSLRHDNRLALPVPTTYMYLHTTEVRQYIRKTKRECRTNHLQVVTFLCGGRGVQHEGRALGGGDGRHVVLWGEQGTMP